MPFVIRAYDPSRDAAPLRQLVIERHEFERELEPSLPESEKIADAYVSTLLERCSRWCGRILMAEDLGAVVGFVAVLARVPPEEPDEVQHEHAYVTDLVVRRRYRRRGLGALLLQHADAVAREAGATHLRVDVLARNTGAHELYERLNFRDFAVKMVKPL
jgi:ribosomal protein S18 acetylase RimI-like enzyme